MTKLETLEQEAFDKNINIYYKDMTLDGFCIKDNVCINKGLSNLKKYWVLVHELEHLELNALYTIDSSTRSVAYYERKVNDSIIRKYKLDELLVKSFQYGIDKWELCNDFDLPFELYDATVNYLYRKGVLLWKTELYF